jgi:hypothetical protein
MRSLRRRVAVVALASTLLIAASCNGDDDDAGPTTTEATTTTSTTTTTAPTTTTTPISGPAPWTEVVQDLALRQWALNTAPDPALVSRVYAEECECYELFHGSIADMASRGEHITGQPARPIAVLPQGETTLNGSRNLLVKYERGEQQLVGADGSVIESIPSGPPVCVALFVTPDGASGAYRIHDYLVPDQCPDGF